MRLGLTSRGESPNLTHPSHGKEKRENVRFEADYAGRRLFGVVQPGGSARGAGGLRAGARLHDRAAVWVGAVGKHYGATGQEIQGDRARERGVSVADSTQFY